MSNLLIKNFHENWAIPDFVRKWGADDTEFPRVKWIWKIWNFQAIFLKMKKKHGISEAFSQKWEKMMEFPIPFQKIQLISEHILNFKWSFRGFIFYKKRCRPQGVYGKFLEWPIIVETSCKMLWNDFLSKILIQNKQYCDILMKICVQKQIQHQKYCKNIPQPTE